MVEHTDHSVGRVMAKLDELPITDDTVVIFYSDNGGPSYARSEPEPTNNAPLRHGKGTLYEGGIRVPSIARWPGTVAPGSTSAAQVSSVDFYPTILEVAGTVAKPKHVGDGVSLVPLLNGQDTLKVRWPVKRIPPMSIIPTRPVSTGAIRTCTPRCRETPTS